MDQRDVEMSKKRRVKKIISSEHGFSRKTGQQNAKAMAQSRKKVSTPLHYGPSRFISFFGGFASVLVSGQ